jgi:ribosomal protein S18 acetylase RimI-like enzyme
MADAREGLVIRELTKDDCPVIAAAFAAQGWNKPVSQYLVYHQESLQGKRTVLVAEESGRFAGYVTIVWESGYPPFRDAGIPEIVDFNVLIAFRRRGIGSALLDESERRIAQRSNAAGIGVGMTADYGPAQILYVRRGYLPDGRGLFQDGRHLEYGDQAVVNDDLALYLTRSL